MIKKKNFMVKVFTAVILLSLLNKGYAVTNSYELKFKSSLASKKVKYKNFSISLYKKNPALKKWLPVYSHNENKLKTPASITKILTAVGLLEKHGTQTRLETKVFTDAKPIKGVVKGNLYVKGSGDPTFVSEKLWLLVNELEKWKITTIQGDIIFDDFVFDQKLLDGDRTKWNQRAYNSFLSGLSLNWNSVRVRFVDPENLLAAVDPVNPYFSVDINKKDKGRSQVEIFPRVDAEHLKITFGSDAYSEEEKSLYRRVNSPRNLFSSQFLQILKEKNIKFLGLVKWEKTPENKFELGSVLSSPMNRIIELMMKYSNNFIADMMTKHMDADYTSESGTYEGGLTYLKANIKKVYPFPSGLVYKSASGLSRKNKFTTSDMTQFLVEVRSKMYFPEFLTSFPISCVDGTLKNRICGRTGLVRAKTGLLGGVSTLAGYYTNVGTDEEYIFTFMYNGSNGEQFDARQTFDNFLEKI